MTRILLAEDDQAMREYLARALERSGYDVVAVDRGTGVKNKLGRTLREGGRGAKKVTGPLTLGQGADEADRQWLG